MAFGLKIPLHGRTHLPQGADPIPGLQFVGVRVRRGNTLIADDTQTAVDFNTVDFDTDGMFSLGTPDQLTVARAGYYHFGGYAAFASSSVGGRVLEITGDPSGHVARASTVNQTSAVAGGYLFAADVALLSVSDVLQMYVTQNSGGNLNVARVFWAYRL